MKTELRSIPKTGRHQLAVSVRVCRRIDGLEVHGGMVDTQRIAEPFQVVLDLDNTLLESVIFRHVHSNFLGLFVKLKQELAVADVRQNVFLEINKNALETFTVQVKNY